MFEIRTASLDLCVRIRGVWKSLTPAIPLPVDLGPNVQLQALATLSAGVNLDLFLTLTQSLDVSLNVFETRTVSLDLCVKTKDAWRNQILATPPPVALEQYVL